MPHMTPRPAPDPRQPLAPDCTDTWQIFKIMAEFVDGFETMAPVPRAVTVFGSARTAPDHPDYKAAVEVGRLLADAGLATITGGGPGIMEAANKGAFQAGGVSVGCNISLPHEQAANPYQTVSIDFHYFYARKVMFLKYASAFVCFPGGYGTMDEFFEVLTLIQTGKARPMPVVLYGRDYWSGLVGWLRATMAPSYINGVDLDVFRLVDTPAEAVELARRGIESPWWGRADDPALSDAPPSAVAEAGEGTRYGKRPRVSRTAVTPQAVKPQQ